MSKIIMCDGCMAKIPFDEPYCHVSFQDSKDIMSDLDLCLACEAPFKAKWGIKNEN